MSPWQPDRLLKTLLVWSAATFIIFWLPTIRGLMDGRSYHWASPFGFSGSGTEGDYWFPVVCSALAISFLYLGWRGARAPFGLLLLGWHGLLAIGATRLAITRPEDFRFQGDTMGIDVSVAWVGPVLFGGFFLLAVRWAVRQIRSDDNRTVPAWSGRNRKLMWLVLGMLPVQLVLLGSSVAQGTGDQLGVLLTLLQWAVISAAFYPWPSRTTYGTTPVASLSS
ncbi:MAG TPA: hypothetical protein VFY65_13480 [Longimicrobium sp.]|nr:hypothetical protein [Longimicrobium sp.]